MTPEWVQAFAAIVTMIAALAALKIAADSPKRSAAFAELYRSQSKALEERDQLRRGVFISLMKCRRSILHQDAIAALNLADVAFADVPSVRQAVLDFVEASEMKPYETTRLVERYYTLTYEVARAVGLSELITKADIRAGYYPEALGTIDAAQLAEAQEKIARAALAKRAGESA